MAFDGLFNLDDIIDDIQFINKTTDKYTTKSLSEMRRIITKLRYATGRLSKQINFDISTHFDESSTQGEFTIILIFPEYGKFILSGRRPGGKLPPKNAIDSWCIIKGIPLKASYNIRKKIARRGIPAVNFTAPIYNNLDVLIKAMEEGLSEQTATNLLNQTVALFERKFKK